MCLIVFSWKSHPKYSLILAANRDEFYERPTRQADFWPDHPNLLAGKDLKAGGTWMGITTGGNFAAVTNFRDPANISPTAKSRGDIPTRFLLAQSSPVSYIENLHSEAELYNGFNILAGNIDTLVHYSNYEKKINAIPPGIHGLSNALLNAQWPKVESVKKAFGQTITDSFTVEDLFKIMSSEYTFPDDELPKTGVPYEWEKAISAICIRTPKYGTCCTTVITVTNSGEVEFYEKTYAVGGRKESLFKSIFQIK